MTGPRIATARTLDPGADRRLLLRSLAVVFTAGPSVFLLALVAAPPDRSTLPALVVVACCAYVVAPLMLLAPARVPRWAEDVFYAWGVLLVTAVIAIPDKVASPYAMFYLWLSLHAASFLSPRRLLLHIATVAVAYGAATVAIGGSSTEIARWVVTCGTIALIAGLVKVLALRLAGVVHELDGMASTDALTGIGNRRSLDHALNGVDGPMTIAMFDLDGFKAYNDAFGHPAGDALLVRLAGRVSEAVGGDGDVFRVGGDEFCVLIHAREDLSDDEIVDRVSAALVENGDGWTIKASCGTARMPGESRDPHQALQLADHRMYAQKHGSRGHGGGEVRNVLMRALHEREPTLREHVNSVRELAGRLAERLRLTASETEELLIAAELHDVGKVAIPDAILGKPGPLTDGEWDYMRRHPIVGERILAESPALLPVARLVRATHERWDGAGYPDNLEGVEIPVGSRILAVCDAFQAMRSERPYRPAMTLEQAVVELTRCSGTQFDPAVVAALRAELASPTVRRNDRAAA